MSNPFHNEKGFTSTVAQVYDEETSQRLSRSKALRTETLNTTREALSDIRMTQQVTSTTLENLDAQKQQLALASTKLAHAQYNTQKANEEITELKRLQKWFAFKNPFKGKPKKVQQDELKACIQETNKAKTLKTGKQRRDMQIQRAGERGVEGASSSMVAMYKDVLDEEDISQEQEIDSNLNEIGSMAAQLKDMALIMGNEVRFQNEIIDDISKRSDHLNQDLRLTEARMKRFK